MVSKTRSLARRLLRVAAIALIAWIVACVLLVGSLRFIDPPTSAFMLQRQWSAMWQHDAAFHLDYEWVPLARISPQLAIAVVASEDQRFPQHRGFDVDAIRDALAAADDGERVRGASTISQQVAKNMFLWGGRSYVRKGLEVWFTALIETLWSKQRILEVYLNIAELGDGIYGAQAASQQHFGRPAADLSTHQAALLAAVLPNPKRLHANRPSAYVQKRAAWIERQMSQLGGATYLE